MEKRTRPWAVMACALLLALGVGTAALADTQGTQTVTTSVPEQPPAAPSWTLNIPADMTIPYGNPETSIGWLTVSDVENVSADEGTQGILCKVTYTDLASGTGIIPLGVVFDFYVDGVLIPPIHFPADITPTTPLLLYHSSQPDHTIRTEVLALVDPADWAAAAPGDYTATVTYESYFG